MVMYSNKRGECCPCTPVYHKRKCYDNTVDVVVRLHDPTDPSTKYMAPPSSADVQLGDVPRTHDPVELQGRVLSARWRDDGVDEVTDAASPKHRYDMTEVDYGGGGHRTRLNDQ